MVTVIQEPGDERYFLCNENTTMSQFKDFIFYEFAMPQYIQILRVGPKPLERVSQLLTPRCHVNVRRSLLGGACCTNCKGVHGPATKLCCDENYCEKCMEGHLKKKHRKGSSSSMNTRSNNNTSASLYERADTSEDDDDDPRPLKKRSNVDLPGEDDDSDNDCSMPEISHGGHRVPFASRKNGLLVVNRITDQILLREDGTSTEPGDIISKINNRMVVSMKTPDVRKLLFDIGDFNKYTGLPLDYNMMMKVRKRKRPLKSQQIQFYSQNELELKRHYTY